MTNDAPARALAIAKRSKSHAEAVAAIIAAGLAEDAADADALIYEGEENEARDSNTRGTA